MEQTPRARYDEFSEQFTTVLYKHWPDILLIVHHHSPRVATLLQTAAPASLRRKNGGWHIEITMKRAVHRERIYQPRDNEVVAQAIRAWAHTAARLKLPRITINFDL